MLGQRRDGMAQPRITLFSATECSARRDVCHHSVRPTLRGDHTCLAFDHFSVFIVLAEVLSYDIHRMLGTTVKLFHFFPGSLSTEAVKLAARDMCVM